jgi:iron(II)-dependent oxidoreductase
MPGLFLVSIFLFVVGLYFSFVFPSGDCTGTTFPPGHQNSPVTWVDMRDASAFCAWYKKRLPNDWEWQYAAQGIDERPYPWGTWDPTRTHPQVTGPVRPLSPSVGMFPNGSSPFGVEDMVGLVWQWTNEFTDTHTRSGLVRGGAYYRPGGSGWYFPGSHDAVRLDRHGKLLLMDSSYDRHGTVGFRCVKDLLA